MEGIILILEVLWLHFNKSTITIYKKAPFGAFFVLMLIMQILIYTSLFCNIFMIGISLITQFITYPSFKSIDLNLFSNFHKIYTRKMLFIVGPVMIIEFLSLAILLFVNFNFNFLIQFTLICLIWVLTFFVIVPIHNKLENQYDNLLNINLIKLNGYRTLIWSLRFILLLFII